MKHRVLILLPLVASLLAGCPISTVPVVKRPRLTTQEGLVKLNNSGTVQLALQGLSARRVLATTDDIESLAIRLETANGVYGDVKQFTRQELTAPQVSVFFENVPAGDATMQVTAIDRTGQAIGKGEQRVAVRARQTSRVNVGVKLDASQPPPTSGGGAATGSVAGTITFEETRFIADNLTGTWFVGLGSEPAPGPIIGCSDERRWFITQEGDKVHGYTAGYNPAQHPTHPNLYFIEQVTGTFKNNKLKLKGEVTYTDAIGQRVGKVERVKYDVEYNAATRHVVGLRNDQAGWAAPFLEAEDCTPMQTPAPIPTPAPIEYPSATPTPVPSMTPSPTPTPTPLPTTAGTPEPSFDHYGIYPNQPFMSTTVYQFVAKVLDRYDHTHDNVLERETVSDPEGFTYEEYFRQEGVSAWTASLGHPNESVTYTTTFDISPLLRDADKNKDKRVTEQELSDLARSFDRNGDNVPEADFFSKYPEYIIHVARI